MSRFTNAEKAAEAEREVMMRREVYGRNAPGGELRPAQAQRIAIMEEIAANYRALAEQDEPTLKLEGADDSNRPRSG